MRGEYKVREMAGGVWVMSEGDGGGVKVVSDER